MKPGDKWPKYDHVALVECFNCGRKHAHEPHYTTGYPAGRGAYRKYCPHCQVWTWFDTDQFKED